MQTITEKLSRFFSGCPVEHARPKYLPPPGPPPKKLVHIPPLPSGSPKPVNFPFLTEQQCITLYSQGFAQVYLPPNHPLLDAATALFSTSHAFFDKPLDEKQKFHRSQLISDPSVSGPRNTEQGWSRVEGEKEMLTIRRTSKLCPPEVAHNARVLWRECGSFMQSIMRAIESSLELESGAFDNVVTQECELPVGDMYETLLRMFRYERTSEPRIVSEKHRDIGLLSLVIGSSPGLEVWDDRIAREDPITGVVSNGDWVAIEENSSQVKPIGGLTFTLLVGETLTALTNQLYKPGAHRVLVPPAESSASDAMYRYSLVFALRPHKQGIIHTPSLQTAITGQFNWPPEDEKGVIARYKPPE